MNQDTIENHIKNLGKVDFDRVASLILKKIFSLNAVDVDGKGDGGSDYRVFQGENGKQAIAIQKTVQDGNWKSKVIEDAQKAKAKLNADSYFFLTSRSHQSADLRALESTIWDNLGMHATCLGAKEIAGIIFERNLLGDFAYAIGLPLEFDYQHRPDKKEILLHSYFAFSDDRHELQVKIYDTTIISFVYHAIDFLTRDALVASVISELGLPEHRKNVVSGRLDSLLSKGKVFKQSDGSISLKPEVEEELKIAEGIYQKEFSALVAVQSLIISNYGGQWELVSAEKAALLLARSFVSQQIKAAENASLSFCMTGFSKDAMEGVKSLKQLIASSGVPRNKCDDVLNELIDHSRANILIKKLATAVVFCSMENTIQDKGAALFGKSNWADTKIILDASVAIPYLLSSLFLPSSGRFSYGSKEVVDLFKKKGALLSLPWHYLNECASHLVSALNYCKDLDDFKDILSFSKNGYVSHYWQLRNSGKKVPETLREYLLSISQSVTQRNPEEAIKSVMRDLQVLFSDYGVEFEYIPKFEDKELRDIEVEYVHVLTDMARKKSKRLIDHDVKVLAHMRHEYARNSNQCMCLTWDGAMVAVSKQINNLGWVVSPDYAGDLFQAGSSLSEGGLLSLAHSVARAADGAHDIGARILDRIVGLAGENMQDWEFRKKIKNFQEEAMNRFKVDDKAFDFDRFDEETDQFLASLGIDIEPRKEALVGQPPI